MSAIKKMKNALISVTEKEGVVLLADILTSKGVNLYASSGTHQYLAAHNIKAVDISTLTGFSFLLGGRVKTLTPVIFAGLLARAGNPADEAELIAHNIIAFDVLIVSLYNFERALVQELGEEAIIENIDIGGVALLRAGAKNFQSVFTVPGNAFFQEAQPILEKGESSLAERRKFAAYTFSAVLEYDKLIAEYFNPPSPSKPLRYGENPHQKGYLAGNIEPFIEQLWGKDLSYNNLLDLDVGLNLLKDLGRDSVAILKHNNPCGVACCPDGLTAFKKAWACDPESAFGGVICAHHRIDKGIAQALEDVFFEILAAPAFDDEALELLKRKKNRILLVIRSFPEPVEQSRTIFAGKLVQEMDNQWGSVNFEVVTQKQPAPQQIEDFYFGEVVVKYLRSNAIVIVRDKQLLGKGCGQTSRVEAVRQAIAQVKKNSFIFEKATLVSDAFFPFTDSVALAAEAGIHCLLQPGGSIRDKEVIDYCNAKGIAMAVTGVRHFRH
jgi:phosphoribosylaminoimidazolecarboxamide formyltransferase/IMP cyclohydrolase